MGLQPIRRQFGAQQGGLGQRGTAQDSPDQVPNVGIARDPGLSVNANQFGAQVGRALQDVGAGLGDLAAVQAQFAERRQNSEDKMFLARAQSEMNRRLFEDQQDRERTYKTGDDALAIFNERRAAIQAEVLASLQEEFNPSQDALSAYELNSEKLAADYGIRTVAFENNEHVKLYQVNLEREIDDLALSAQRTGDWDTASAALEQRISAAEDMFTPSELATLTLESRRKLAFAYYNGFTVEDPAGAWQSLNGEGSIVGALIQQESGGDFTEVGADGEGGAMQVMPDTARRIARQMGDENFPINGSDEEIRQYLIDADNRGSNGIRYGTFEIKRLLRKYNGDVEAALIGYNAGEGRSDRWLANGRDDNVIPASTRKYYRQVVRRMGSAEGPITDLTPNDHMTLLGRAERGRNVMVKKFEDKFAVHVASIEQTGVGLDGFDIETGSAFMTPEQLEIVREVEEQAFRDHTDISTIMHGSTGEAASVVAESAPQPGSENFVAQTKRHERFRKAAIERQDTLDSTRGSDKFDPAGHALRGQEDVASAYQDALETGDPQDWSDAIDVSREAQRSMSVHPDDIRVLPKTIAKQVVTDIGRTPSGERAIKLQAVMEQFGDESGTVLREMIDAGLPASSAIAATYIDDTALSQEIITASENVKEIEEAIKSRSGGGAVTQIKETIAAEMEPFRNAFQAGDYTGSSTATYNSIVGVVTALALKRANEGATDPGDTVDQMINDRFHVGLMGGTVYAPTEFSEAEIEGAGDAMQTRKAIEAFTPRPFGRPGAPDFLEIGATIEAAVRDGFWATNSAGDGAVLMVPIGRGGALPLVNARGDTYGFKFNQASGIVAQSDSPFANPTVTAP